MRKWCWKLSTLELTFLPYSNGVLTQCKQFFNKMATLPHVSLLPIQQCVCLGTLYPLQWAFIPLLLQSRLLRVVEITTPCPPSFQCNMKIFSCSLSISQQFLIRNLNFKLFQQKLNRSLHFWEKKNRIKNGMVGKWCFLQQFSFFNVGNWVFQLETVLWKMLFWFISNMDLFLIGCQHES